MNVGKSRIRHRTTLEWHYFLLILSRSRNSSLNWRVGLCWARLFPTLYSKIKWLVSELPLITIGLRYFIAENCLQAVNLNRFWQSKIFWWIWRHNINRVFFIATLSGQHVMKFLIIAQFTWHFVDNSLFANLCKIHHGSFSMLLCAVFTSAAFKSTCFTSKAEYIR